MEGIVQLWIIWRYLGGIGRMILPNGRRMLVFSCQFRVGFGFRLYKLGCKSALSRTRRCHALMFRNDCMKGF